MRGRADRVAITGATGFIGSHIVRAFCKRGIRPRCLARSSSDLSGLDGLDIEVRYGDIRDPATLLDTFDGCRAVVHNAALVADWGRTRDFYAINVRGTDNVMDACLQSGVRHIVMAGSNAVYGEEDSREIKDEDAPLSPHYRYFLDSVFPCKLNAYRDTKALATVRASRFASRHGLDLTILDPVWVYGERELRTLFCEYLQTVKGGMKWMPGCGTNKFHVVYAGDLAEAYYAAYHKRLSGVHRVIIGDESAVPMRRIFRLFCSECGLEMPRSLPKIVVYPISLAMEALYTALGARRPPLLTRGRVNLFYDSIEYSVEKSKEFLNHVNRHTLERGIEKTVSWYRQNGQL